MASGIQLNSTNNSEMNIVYQGTSGATRTVVMPDKSFTVADQAESVITLGTAQATTSGTYKDFAIPSGVKRVTVMLDGVSTNGSSAIQVQLGDSGGIETTGYASVSNYIKASASISGSAYTTGFGIYALNSASTRIGSILLNNITGNSFTCFGNIYDMSDASVNAISGAKTLSAELTTVRITTVNGTDTFDAGTVNVSWEY